MKKQYSRISKSTHNHNDKLKINKHPYNHLNPDHIQTKKRKLVVVSIATITFILASTFAIKSMPESWFGVLAETNAKLDLVSGVRKLAKTRPSLASGSVNITYNDSPNLNTVGFTYKTVMESNTGNSSGKGKLTINRASFPYEYITIKKDHYMKLDNLKDLKKIIKPSSQLYPYLETRFDVLSKYSDKWLLKEDSSSQPSNNQQDNKYECLLSTYPYLSSDDAQKLQSAFSRNTPIKVKKTAQMYLNGEKVTRIDLVPNKSNDVDRFSAIINSLTAVQKINSCTQSIANTPALPKVKDAYKNNSVTMSVYINKEKTIKKVTLNTDGQKSKIQMVTNFEYTKQKKVSAPSGAISADPLFKALFE